MRNTILVSGLLLLLALGVGMFAWTRSVFARDVVRTALASQLANAIGQPVTVGDIGAGIFPRVTVRLGDVAIGDPVRIRVRTLLVGTRLTALLSRRIEGASVSLEGARVELPMPPAAATSLPETPADGPAGGGGSGAPVEIVSVDEISLTGVEIVSGGRTLSGDLDASINGQSLTVRSATLVAEDTRVELSGTLTDWSGPVGDLTLEAGQLNLDRLMAFLTDFSSSLQPSAPAPAGQASPSAPGLKLAVTVQADSASSGQLTLNALTGRALVTGDRVELDPIAFNMFGGRYDGSMSMVLEPPAFQYRAKLSGIDVATAMDYAGQAGIMTGRLSGTIDLAGSGADLGAVIKRARGSARVDITNGIVKGLGLVRSVVVATSMKSGAGQGITGSTDEPFTRLGATLTITNGAASTRDLRFESDSLSLDAAGAVRIDGTAVNLAGAVQLSEALTAQAGTDLVRYTQEQGRVTLSATITGTSQNLIVRVDAADVAKRAIINRANEEVKKRLGGIVR